MFVVIYLAMVVNHLAMFFRTLLSFTILSVVWAGSPAASTVVLNDTEITFAVNLPANSSDLYFSFSAPAHSWAAVGAGSTMKGSLMFIIYSSGPGNGTSALQMRLNIM
jgi:hypothetical protein